MESKEPALLSQKSKFFLTQISSLKKFIKVIKIISYYFDNCHLNFEEDCITILESINCKLFKLKIKIDYSTVSEPFSVYVDTEKLYTYLKTLYDRDDQSFVFYMEKSNLNILHAEVSADDILKKKIKFNLLLNTMFLINAFPI